MMQLLQSIKSGQNVVEVCELGDRLLTEGCANTYKKLKDSEKGVAFPTCVSVNHCVSHFSPLPEEANLVLKPGDLVKIDLGAHIDGYISTCAHTLLLPIEGAAEAAITGRLADVICAAHFAAECAVRLARPGKTNADVTSALRRVADVFHVQPVEGVLSHRMRQHVIDANQVVLNRGGDPEHQVDEFTFENNQVYCFDIVMSTGEGRTRAEADRTTVFKRALDRSYQLKLQASRQVMSEISKRFPTLPFTLRALDEKKRRLGIVELVKHDLLDAYPVLYEKDGEMVAQFKFTCLVLPNSTMRLNAFPLPHVSSQYAIDSDAPLKQILAMSTKRTNKKKKKKPAGAGAGAKAKGEGEEQDGAEEEGDA